MSTTYHTAIATGAAAKASTFNSPMGQLDAAIESVNTTLDAMADNGVESVVAATTLDLSGFNYTYHYVVTGDTQIATITPPTLPATSSPTDNPIHIYLIKTTGLWSVNELGNIEATHVVDTGEVMHLVYMPSLTAWYVVR